VISRGRATTARLLFPIHTSVDFHRDVEITIFDECKSTKAHSGKQAWLPVRDPQGRERPFNDRTRIAAITASNAWRSQGSRKALAAQDHEGSRDRKAMSWYRIRIEMDGDTFFVTSPDFPEVTTYGETIEAAVGNGRDAIEEAIAARISEGRDVPVSAGKRGKKGHYIQLSTLSLLKAALYVLARQRKVSRAELARRLGWHREQVDRLFRLDHNSRLDQLEAAFAALGVKLQSKFQLSEPKAA
jgi:antitoxin HicB